MEKLLETVDDPPVNLPDGAVYKASPNKTHDEVVIFIHHFGGTKLSSKSHQDYFNQLGYDCIAFDFLYQDLERMPKDLKTLKAFSKGLRHAWADQIEEIFRKVEGPKIVFSFSFLGGSALEAIAKTRAHNIRAWICEGGPFLNIFQCYWNYLNRFHRGLWLPAKVLALAGGFFALGIYDFKADIKNYFQLIPKDLPIFSIRAWQDKLVPISAIDEFFAQSDAGLRLEILSIPEADHLQGLREFPEDYKPRLQRFLDTI